MKTIVTITGIRPDFIRMVKIFKKLDENFNHILIHTGQHYDKLLSDVFFKELNIRKPNFNLCIGGSNREHFHQSADVSVKIIELLRKEKIDPDIIIFLGDSNSVCCAVSLKKEGYKIGHIEAGMRSYDKKMLEEINRVVCDHCSDFLFVYHPEYASQLAEERVHKGVYIVGNTIVEVCQSFAQELFKTKKKSDQIILDIHRPENFKYPERLQNIISYANQCIEKFGVPVRMLNFKRTLSNMHTFEIPLGKIELIDMLSYKKFLEIQYHSLFMISDSGTAQEEPALLNTPVIVPRDFTERPQSVKYNCSFMIDVNSKNGTWEESLNWLTAGTIIDSEWLGDGTTSKQIIDILKREL